MNDECNSYYITFIKGKESIYIPHNIIKNDNESDKDEDEEEWVVVKSKKYKKRNKSTKNQIRSARF